MDMGSTSFKGFLNLERHTCSIRIRVRMVRANECESCCHISQALLIAFVDSSVEIMCDSCTHKPAIEGTCYK